jgi:hypothetical protein
MGAIVAKKTDTVISDSVFDTPDSKTSVANGSAKTCCSKCDSITTETADRGVLCEKCVKLDSTKVEDFFRNSNGGLNAQGQVPHGIVPQSTSALQATPQSQQGLEGRGKSQNGHELKFKEPAQNIRGAETRVSAPVTIPKARSQPLLASAATSSPKRHLPTDRWKAFKVNNIFLQLV